VVMLEPHDWLSPSQTARRLDLSLSRVRQLTDEGRLSYVRTPLGKLIAASDVDRLAAERAGREGADR
jgi:excisionase family DNA binding protein